MDIIKERLEREFKLALIPTAPTVVYRVTKNDGKIVMVDNPAKLPDIQEIQRIEEPMIMASLITPEQYVGALIAFCQERRGIQKEIELYHQGPRPYHLRSSAERDRHGLLRQAQIADQRVCLARL